MKFYKHPYNVNITYTTTYTNAESIAFLYSCIHAIKAMGKGNI